MNTFKAPFFKGADSFVDQETWEFPQKCYQSMVIPDGDKVLHNQDFLHSWNMLVLYPFTLGEMSNSQFPQGLGWQVIRKGRRPFFAMITEEIFGQLLMF